MRRRKSNPSVLESTLLTGGALIVGGLGGFALASWVCGKAAGDVGKSLFDPHQRWPPTLVVSGDVVCTEGSDSQCSDAWMSVEEACDTYAEEELVRIDGTLGSHGKVTQLRDCLETRGVRVQLPL